MSELAPNSNLALSIQVTPAEEVVIQPSEQLALVDEYSKSVQETSIILRPGDPSPLLIQLKNVGTSPLTLRLMLQVEGYFLPAWYRILLEEQHLEPGQSTDGSIYFSIPNDFFENPFPFPGGKFQTLEFTAFLAAWAVLGETNTLLQSVPLNLAIRPHSLYLNFLPAFYGEVDFVGRFLSIFEKAFEPSVQMLETLCAYLDPLTAPKSLLPFLAHWVAWPIDPRWDELQQRKLIRKAVEIYRWRGTRRGLRLFLHLYTGLPLDENLPESEKHISIEEIFTEGFVLNASTLGVDTILGGGRPFHFIVRLRSPQPDQIDKAMIRQILEREKPAFCTYELYLEQSVEAP
jgi:phage tail-like protein